jgi:hypothetical protein
MQTKSLLALTAALLGSAALTPGTATAATPVTCSQLATLLSSNSNISQTASDNQGLVSPSAHIVAASGTNAAYCQVHLQFSSRSGPTYGYAPGESQTIGINVGLPLNSVDGGTGRVQGAWNGKVENLGGGGLIGSIGSTTSATNAGFVGSSTDGGHNSAQNGTHGNFGVIQATHQLDVGKLEDFALESQHQQYVWALWLANAYYGQPASRNYWNGCSTGGRQGMALAGNYGSDFDGILAGAPTVYENNLDLAHKWVAVVNRDDVVGAGHPAITTAQYNTAVAHAIAACDVEGADAVADGVVDDPRQCTYSVSGDPTILAHPAGTCTGANCFDSVQAAAMDKIWYGPTDHNGRRLWHPWSKVMTGGMIVVGPVIDTSQKDMYYDHKDLNYDTQNLYSTQPLAAQNPFSEPAPISIEDEFLLSDNGPEPYLASANYQGIIDNVFNGPKHGKIIMWQGAADPLVFWQDGLQYYRYVATLFGGGTTDFAGLSSWYRYYHAPGVGHCGGGVGASPLAVTLPDGNSQIFDDLVKWVENGVVPQSAGDSTNIGILATGPGSFGTRPICPWPTTAIYSGTGSTKVASNYVCDGNLDAFPPTPAINNVATICEGLLTRANGHGPSNSLDYKEQGVSPSQCPNP